MVNKGSSTRCDWDVGIPFVESLTMTSRSLPLSDDLSVTFLVGEGQ